MPRILNVISAVTPMGGTIAKLRVLMTQSKMHKHYIYQPSFKSDESELLKEREWYKQHGIPSYYGIYGRNIIKNAWAVTKIIKANNIDIVHYYFNHEQSFAGIVKLLNPHIAMVRSFVGYNKLSPFRRMMLSVSQSFISNYIYISQFIKNAYEKDYPRLTKKSSQIIYNGPINVQPVKTKLQDRHLIVGIGGLCPVKNYTVLIEAMNIIVNRYHRKDINLYILGDGPDRVLYEEKIKEYSIQKNMILVGYSKNTSEYLNDCAIFVHPAKAEGFGIAVVEAMQMHCPCIVADKGALPELIVDGESGYVVDAFNAKAWAEKIIYLYDHLDECMRMGENAYKRAMEKFSLDAFVRNHDEYYNSLLTQK